MCWCRHGAKPFPEAMMTFYTWIHLLLLNRFVKMDFICEMGFIYPPVYIFSCRLTEKHPRSYLWLIKLPRKLVKVRESWTRP